MKFSRILGEICGVPLSIITFTVSFIRNARTFHPNGIHAQCEVKTLKDSPLTFHPYALARFTGAIWKKNQLLPDVLGISLRFSEIPFRNTEPRKEDQDLLFASFRLPIEIPIAPFITRFSKFYLNTFYAISPFQVHNETVHFKITIVPKTTEGKRMDNMLRNIHEHAILILWYKKKKTDWIPVAELSLLRSIEVDQHKLRFNPYRSGLGINPEGFVHALRIPVYPMSQLGRSLRYRFQEVLHKAYDRFIVQRL